ncbi:MAG: MarR family transcriptional regulator, partial [Pseudomonadota bacterium]
MIDKKDDKFLETNIKGMMMTLIAHWNAQMDDAVAGTEFADIRTSDLRVFAQLRGRTMKLSDIHRELGFTRQAAQQAVSRLVDHGLITVQFEPGNQRDKVITITRKGQRRRTMAARQIKAIEKSCANIIGTDETEQLRGL